jgi:hypothetical protein
MNLLPPETPLPRRSLWSLAKAVIGTVLIGILTPYPHLILNFLVIKLLPWSEEINRVVGETISTAIILSVWVFFTRRILRNINPFYIASSWTLSRITGLALLLYIVGLSGSTGCYYHHLCMEGHMAHGPYPIGHYIFDSSWSLSLVLAVLIAAFQRSAYFIPLSVGASYLIIYRFAFGSFGGIWHFPV